MGQTRVHTTRFATVVIDVDHPALRAGRLGDLMRVPGRRDARADVEELRHPGLAGQVPDGAAEEVPVGPGHRLQGRDPLAHGGPEGAGTREVVLAAVFV